MSNFANKILGIKPKKTKEEEVKETLDVRRRAHFVKKKPAQTMFADAEAETSVLEDYYNAKEKQRSNAFSMYGQDFASVDPNQYNSSEKLDHLDRYVSVHAEMYTKERIENMDEDDVSDNEGDRKTGMMDFMNEHLAHFGAVEDDEPLPGREERRSAFNDELEIGAQRLKGQFGFESLVEETKKPQDSVNSKGTKIDDNFPESARGTEVVKKTLNIQKEQDDDDIDEQELMDNVDDMNFDNNFRDSNVRHRGSSAFVSNTATQRGMTPEQVLEQRTKLMSAESKTTDSIDRFSRHRQQSVIMRDRLKLIEKKIQRDQQEGEKLISHKYDEIAKSKAEQFLYKDRHKDETMEMKQKKDEIIMKFRKELEQDENDKVEEVKEEEMLNEMFEEQENDIIEKESDQDSQEVNNFLTEWYQEHEMINNYEHTNEIDDLFASQIEKDDLESTTRNQSLGFDLQKESVDLIRFVDQNERRHQVESQKYLKQNSQLESFLQNNITQHVLTEHEEHVRDISQIMVQEKQYHNTRWTTVSMTEDLILIGNSVGELWMYAIDTYEYLSKFVEKGKEFQYNSITAIAVHPVKSDYVLLGYKGGQIVLLDVTDYQKSLKVIKDHHKGIPIANLAFCDMMQKKNTQFHNLQKVHDHQRNESMNSMNPYEDISLTLTNADEQDKKKQTEALHEWMFVSIDREGKVIINSISKRMFIFQASKFVIIEPNKEEPKFLSVACRFISTLHPQQKINDLVNLIAVANSERALVLAITAKESQLIREIKAPQYEIPGQQNLLTLRNIVPSITWGYGHSPVLKDKCYATLAIGWGPYIQTYMLNNVMDEEKQIFIDDGFFVLKPQQSILESRATSMVSTQSNEKPVRNSFDKRASLLQEINPYEQENRYQAIQQSLNYASSVVNQTPFEMFDLFIERMYYLSDSLIIVLTRSLEMRILYTQKMHPGTYKAKTFLLDQYNNRVKEEENLKKKKQQGCVVDEGLFISNIAQSEQGQAYNQTLAIFNGTILAIGIQGLLKYTQMRWDESLLAFKELTKGNWIQEFARAIDIYTGKIKGFKDVPEEQYVRQESMKAELKLFIRNVITEQLEKWNDELQKIESEVKVPRNTLRNSPVNRSNLDESNVEILNFLEEKKYDEKKARYRTLIRIGIEFCVTIQDCYFLFYDLFLLFQEEELEQDFLEELKPFIVAGRFSNWDLPDDILQNHIINYYKDPHKPEQIEKIIVNLNLANCSKDVIAELIQFAETHFLSTALLYLHTEAINQGDKSSCSLVILALLDLYKQAKDTNPGRFEDLQYIQQLSSDAIERLRAEKSQFYLGYKILWVIRLFLNGKKFPQGNIDTNKWKKSVHEIVDCISTKNIMLDLLFIDAEAYFQIIAILFYRGKVFDFIREEKLQQEKIIKTQQSLVKNPLISDDLYQEIHQRLSHEEILKRFERVCSSTTDGKFQVPEDIRMQYLFFVANVASKSNIKKEPKFYLQCVKELLTQSQKLLKFNQALMLRAQKKKGKLMSNQHKVKDENKHIYVTENALMELIDLCEPIEDQEIDELIKMTKYTRFNQLRVKLLERREDFVQCLQLYVEGMKINSYAATRKEAVNRIFDWICNVLDQFAAKKVGNKKESTPQEDALRNQIMTEFNELVNLDAQQAFLLIDEKFNNEHEKFLQSLITNGSQEQQYKYLETMLTTHHDKIQNCIEQYLMDSAYEFREKALTYMKLQNQHFKLLCQNYPKKVLERVRRIKKNEVHFTLDDCLEICQEFNQVEACAILTNKMTNYLSSCTHYMTLLTDSNLFSYPKLIKQIQTITKQKDTKFPHFIPYLGKEEKAKIKEILRVFEQGTLAYPENTAKFSKNEWNTSLCLRFDYLLRKVIKISIKESTENINEETIAMVWFYMLDSMLKVRSEQITILETIRDRQIDQTRQTGLLYSAIQAQYDIEEVKTKYDEYINILRNFFKSRIDFAIEHTLKHIELKDFLDHIVRNDDQIRYKELKDMIITIFGETSMELTVLFKANTSANQLSISNFDLISYHASHGILFRYRQCNICHKMLDEQIKENHQKKMFKRQQTFMKGYIPEDDDGLDAYDPQFDNMTLYDCGHAFHNKCIERYIQEKLVQAANLKNGQTMHNQFQNPKQAKNQRVTLKMMKNQQCPWCFNPQFKVDFATISEENEKAIKRGDGRGGALALTSRSSDMQFEETKSDEGEFFSDFEEKKKQRIIERRASVAKPVKSEAEQRMDMFNLNFINESVTMLNFEQY